MTAGGWIVKIEGKNDIIDSRFETMAGWVKLLKHHIHTDKFNVDVDLGVDILLLSHL